MTDIWDVVVADDLSKIREAADFLQSFCPPGADPVWTEAYYQWKLGAQNPAGPGFMTLAMLNDTVIGVTTITRKRLWINGREVIGGEIGDTYTHPDFLRRGTPSSFHSSTSDPGAYLNKSIFGRLVTETVERAHQNGIAIIYGTPNANSMPGYVKRLNFIEYSNYTNRNFIRPTTQGIIQKFPALKTISPILQPIDKMIARLASLSYKSHIRVSPLKEELKNLDTLCEATKIQSGFTILQDCKWFQYRFLDTPHANYQLHAVHHKDKFVGIIVTRHFNTMNGRPSCYIADWLIENQDANILRAAIAQIITEKIDQTMDGFVIWLEDNSIAARALKKIGFIPSGMSPIIFWNSPEFQNLQSAQPDFNFSIAFSDNV